MVNYPKNPERAYYMGYRDALRNVLGQARYERKVGKDAPTWATMRQWADLWLYRVRELLKEL